MINQAGETTEKFLSGLYYILQNDAEYFYPNLKERVAQLLGYVDSYKNTRFLLETLQNENPDRRFLKARMGAVFGLTQIGLRYPDRQTEIISVFNEVFYKTRQMSETEDILESQNELQYAIIQALGNMQNSSLKVRKLLQNTITFSYGTLMTVYAAKAISKLDLEPAFSAEITNTLLLALSNSDSSIRNAVWESLKHLEQKIQENSSSIIPS